MDAARAVVTLAAIAALAGCAGNSVERSALTSQPVLWGTYQHSADRNAVFEGYSSPQTWSYGANAKINSGFALAGNTLLFTTFSRKLVALDVRSGRELWHANLTNIAMSTPIVAGNTVYVGTGMNGDLPRPLRSRAIVRNMLLRLQFGKDQIWGRPQGDEVAAFDLRTGASRWKFPTVGEDMPSAVYDSGRIIFANGDSHAYALRADTGKKLWSTDIGSVATMASAVVVGQTVVVAVCGKNDVVDEAIALDVSTGKIAWRTPYGQCDAAPAFAAGKVFVASAILHSKLLLSTRVAALNPVTGKPLWVYRGKPGPLTFIGSSEQAIAGTYASRTYFQAEPFANDVVALDASTGKVQWRFQTSGPVKMSPVIAGGRLYVGDTVGLFYTLDARNGRLLELRAFTKPFTTSPPIIVGNKLIIANDTSVHAIPLSGTPTDHRYTDEIFNKEASATTKT